MIAVARFEPARCQSLCTAKFSSICRELKVYNRTALLSDEEHELPKGLALLTQLRSLDMIQALVPVSSLSPILGLPGLEDLHIALAAQGHPTPLCLSSERLTRLKIFCGLASSVR